MGFPRESEVVYRCGRRRSIATACSAHFLLACTLPTRTRGEKSVLAMLIIDLVDNIRLALHVAFHLQRTCLEQMRIAVTQM
jgi:hypothetical protein